MTQSEIQPVPNKNKDQSTLVSELEEAQRILLEAEGELAKEQAEVNAFRMHCRLKLDSWIDRLLILQTEKQSLLIRLELYRQAQDFGIPFGEGDAFWQGEGESSSYDDDEELILPTDVPHDKEAEKRLYRRLARKFHPDLGNTALEVAYRTEMMSAINQAYATDNVQALYDLADQLEPSELSELSAITSPQIRQLQRQLIEGCASR